MQLDAFVELAKSRRAVRHFETAPIEEAVLEKIIEAGLWAPSGYNLQPIHITKVTDQAVKEKLYGVAMKQSQVKEAPVILVVSGDIDVMKNNFEKVIARELESGAVNEKYIDFLKKVVPLAFGRGPLGIGKFWKKYLLPIVGLYMPLPEVPAADMKRWLGKQGSLTAMNMMLAAKAAGLGSCPMEGFDNMKVRSVLKMPRSQWPILLIPIGKPVDAELKKTRLPEGDLIHENCW